MVVFAPERVWSSDAPRCTRRSSTREKTQVSPWVALVEKSVQFAPGEPPQIYHCLTQADYVGVLAVTPRRACSGRSSVPALCRGFHVGVPRRDGGRWRDGGGRCPARVDGGGRTSERSSLSTSAAFQPGTGRLQVRSHAFFARASRPHESFAAERGIETKLVTLPELRRMMRAMEFRHHCTGQSTLRQSSGVYSDLAL